MASCSLSNNLLTNMSKLVPAVSPALRERKHDVLSPYTQVTKQCLHLSLPLGGFLGGLKHFLVSRDTSLFAPTRPSHMLRASFKYENTTFGFVQAALL